jgi:hypothetical protein
MGVLLWGVGKAAPYLGTVVLQCNISFFLGTRQNNPRCANQRHRNTSMLRTTTALLSAVLVAACNPSDKPVTEDPAPAEAFVVPAQGGFLPLRPTEIEAPGSGAWVCTPAGAGQVSRCVPRGAAHRPGVVPGVSPALDTAIEPTIEGPTAAEALDIVRQREALPMDAP